VLAGLLLAAGLVVAFRPGSGSGSAQVGEPAPLFTATTLDGSTLSLADLRGRPVLLNFWASWCDPCRDEFPLLRSLHDSDEGPAVVGVVFEDGAGSARRFAADQKAGWPMALDPEGRIASAYGVAKKPGIPVTVFIDARGVVTRIHLGELKASDLD
jgi:cytochrome c biogenesis protein CcmG, thiol:disulfide interchange protein DsbE